MGDAKPKMDFKMFVMPAMLLLSRKVAFTTPNPDYICDEEGTCPDVKIIPKELPNDDMIQKAQIALATIAIVLMSIFYLVYSKVNAKGKEADKDIWVPPKPKPTLPFGLGPPAEPIKIEDFKQTTMREHEKGLVKETAQAMAVMVPLNAADSVVVKKYVLGSEAAYGELTAPPTAAIIKAMNDAADAAGAAADPPKVEELPDVPSDEKKKEEKKSTSVKDID